MKPTGVTKFVVVALAAILLLGVSRTQAQTPANVAPSPTPLPISKDQRETIETVIREYLLKNPSIVREAMRALQAQEEKEKQERAANSLKSLEKDIYSDPDSPTVGNPKGDVSIVVFFDYHCGYCKQSLPALRELLTKDSSIRIVYKEVPILGPESQVAARAALAASRQGEYEAFHYALIKSDEISNDAIKRISGQLGLNYSRLQKDMNDPKISEALERNFSLAASLGIDGTPTYIVGGQIIPGAVDSEALAKFVLGERARVVAVKEKSAIQN